MMQLEQHPRWPEIGWALSRIPDKGPCNDVDDEVFRAWYRLYRELVTGSGFNWAEEVKRGVGYFYRLAQFLASQHDRYPEDCDIPVSFLGDYALEEFHRPEDGVPAHLFEAALQAILNRLKERHG